MNPLLLYPLTMMYLYTLQTAWALSLYAWKPRSPRD